MGFLAELFFVPLIGKVFDELYEFIKGLTWPEGMQKYLNMLQKILPGIKAVVAAYNQVEIKDPALNKWYWQLRDAVDEADDVLDEIEYTELQKQASQNKKRKLVEIFKNDPNLTRLKEAVQKHSKISAQLSTFLPLLKDEKEMEKQQQLKLLETRKTGSTPANVLVGRSEELEFVNKWLRNSYETQSSTDPADLYRNISLLSVVGLGGMGKTTLLQRVFEDVILNKDGATEGFDVKMWASVSHDVDAQTVLKNILKSLDEKVSHEETLHSLQKRLISEVRCKRFLLVLDDIWEEGEAEWEKVLAPLQYGSLGSKILITTRIDSVASMFAPMIKKGIGKLPLEGLEEEDLLTLLNTYAFAGVDNPDDEFRSITEMMVKRLLRSPLAAKVIGKILNSYVNKSFWRNVLDTNIRSIKPVKSGQNDLLAILKLSYIYLPEYLKNCLSFCSVFPQDYEFDKEDLVRMWIELGYIQSSNIQGETLENTGRMYFDFLVERSFFDEFSTYKVFYKMHDLQHELVQSISEQESLSVVGDKDLKNLPATIRHLSIDTRNPEEAFKQMEKFKNLRSLFLSFQTEYSYNLTDVLSKIFKASKSIRLLVIYAPHGLEIPEGIDCLIHLRYLKVKCGWDAVKFPTSTSNLYHLQFVIFDRRQNLMKDGWEKLRPNENCHLILTDELVIRDPSELLMEPLRSISYLRFMRIQENDELVSFPTETEQWFRQQSSSLSELRFVKLTKLESLPSLSTFSSLNSLQLWNIPLLESLPDLPSSLKNLELINLESLQCQPSSLSTISSLHTLKLYHIPLLESLPDLPSSLKNLELELLKSLQCLRSLSAISSLDTLKLHDIPLLKSLSGLPSSLKELKVEELKSLRCLPSSLSSISSLETLELHHIPLLKSLSNLPSSLKKLILGDLKSLRCERSSLAAISSLETLELYHIPLFKSLPDLPSSLKKLDLYYLKSLKCLPSSLSAISSLNHLRLEHIRLLKSLPDLPFSLIYLDLEELKSLQCLPSSLSSVSSLCELRLVSIPPLKSLPVLPSSLKKLTLSHLKSLQCLPSSLSAISSLDTLNLSKFPLLESLPDLPSSLENLWISEVHGPLELPNLPASLKVLHIYNCNPQLMERRESFRKQRSNE